MTGPKTLDRASGEGRAMRISRLEIAGGVALLLAVLSVGLLAQDQSSPSHEERLKAINLVRAINTAEFRYSMGTRKDANDGHGRFAGWTELYGSGLLNQLQVSGEGPEIIPGYRLDLIVSPDGNSFMVALHDRKEGDGLFSVFSDQTGIIYLGAPLQ
jgi:hypothetical protein